MTRPGTGEARPPRRRRPAAPQAGDRDVRGGRGRRSWEAMSRGVQWRATPSWSRDGGRGPAAGASVTATTLIMMHSRDDRSRSQPVSATVTAKRATARPSTDRLGAKKDGGVAGETLGAGTSLLVSLYEGGCCMSESV